MITHRSWLGISNRECLIESDTRQSGGVGTQPNRAAITAADDGSLRPSPSTPPCNTVNVAGCQHDRIISELSCSTRSRSQPIRVLTSITSPVVSSTAAAIRSGTADWITTLLPLAEPLGGLIQQALLVLTGPQLDRTGPKTTPAAP